MRTPEELAKARHMVAQQFERTEHMMQKATLAGMLTALAWMSGEQGKGGEILQRLVDGEPIVRCDPNTGEQI